MFQVGVAATTPPVTVVCSSTSSITKTVTMTTTTTGLIASVKYDVVLLAQLLLTDTMRGSVGLTIVLLLQQAQSQMSSQAYADYARGPPQVIFFFQS